MLLYSPISREVAREVTKMKKRNIGAVHAVHTGLKEDGAYCALTSHIMGFDPHWLAPLGVLVQFAE